VFGFLRRWRRRQALKTPWPAWQDVLLRRRLPYFDFLEPSQQQRLRERIHGMIHEMHWEGCKGLHVTHEMKITIAAWAGLLALGLSEDVYDRVSSILIYPDDFATPNPEDWEDDELTEPDKAGLAVYRGPVILSWRMIQSELADPHAQTNVILHEFAHQLDFLDGAIDGTPPLPTAELARRWGPVMQAAFERHRADVAQQDALFFTEHAAENETEFFADAVEAFFCAPWELESHEPGVAQLLRDYFQLDPRVWQLSEPQSQST